MDDIISEKALLDALVDCNFFVESGDREWSASDIMTTYSDKIPQLLDSLNCILRNTDEKGKTSYHCLASKLGKMDAIIWTHIGTITGYSKRPPSSKTREALNLILLQRDKEYTVNDLLCILRSHNITNRMRVGGIIWNLLTDKQQLLFS